MSSYACYRQLQMLSKTHWSVGLLLSQSELSSLTTLPLSRKEGFYKFNVSMYVFICLCKRCFQTARTIFVSFFLSHSVMLARPFLAVLDANWLSCSRVMQLLVLNVDFNVGQVTLLRALVRAPYELPHTLWLTKNKSQ